MMENNQNKNPEFVAGTNWDNQATQLQKKFPELTPSDLKLETGKEQELITRVENRLNKTHEEVINIMNQVKAECETVDRNQGQGTQGNQGSGNQGKPGNQGQGNQGNPGQGNQGSERSGNTF